MKVKVYNGTKVQLWPLVNFQGQRCGVWRYLMLSKVQTRLNSVVVGGGSSSGNSVGIDGCDSGGGNSVGVCGCGGRSSGNSLGAADGAGGNTPFTPN